MRIAIVGTPHVPVPPPKYGGTEQIIHHLIKGLVELGHEPILIGTGDSQVDCEVIPVVDKAIYFPEKTSDLPAFQKYVAKLTKKTQHLVAQVLGRVDIIHSHGFDLKAFTDFPTLTTIHNPIEFEHLSYYEKCQDRYFASISQNQQESCPALNYIGVVYNGENPDDFPIVEEPEDYLCFLGRFERKNPHLAVQLAIGQGVKVKLAGKLDYHGESYFKEEIEQYLDHPLVEYLGELGFDDKVELISKAKCNLHPTSFREPFGLTVLEAAYCGTPTLAISRGSMPELIEEGRTGMLVEDFIEGYHHVQQCFEMNRRYIADRARHLFNYQNMAGQYVTAYRRVIEAFKTSTEDKPLFSSSSELLPLPSRLIKT